MITLPRPLVLAALLGAVLPLSAEEPAASSPALTPPVDGRKLTGALDFSASDNAWHLDAGYQWRQMGSLGFQTGSLAAHSSLPWLAGGRTPSGFTTSNPGSASTAGPNGLGNHTYSDGFVNEDSSGPSGSTWNWGYNSASQLNGTTLTYQGVPTSSSTSTTTYSSSRMQSSSLRNDLGWGSDLSGSGWFATVESPALFKSHGISVDAQIGYSYASSGAAHGTSGVFQASQSQSTGSRTTTTTNTSNTTDTYDASGIIVPTAPYAGTFNGPGPIINETPLSRSNSASTAVSSTAGPTQRHTASFMSNASETLHLDLHTVSFGAHATWTLGRVHVGLATGLALNIAQWDSSYNEQLYGNARLIKTFNANASGTKVLPGFYLEPTLEVSLTQRICLFTSGRYDWAGGIHGVVGPSSFDFKTGGWSIRAGLGYTF